MLLPNLVVEESGKLNCKLQVMLGQKVGDRPQLEGGVGWHGGSQAHESHRTVPPTFCASDEWVSGVPSRDLSALDGFVCFF